ncbi:MAG: insulinase family protein [Paraprevotella sp.]|nr:insulinase family protein [Paraprevotella sp.]
MKRHLYHWLSHAVLSGAAWLVCIPLTAQSLTDTIRPAADIVEGRLRNGLRYILKKNDTPTSRTEFRLIMRVGSVQETEQQKGGAHFLEHIAFGGTRHFPRRGAVEYLESLGMKYGQDINAYTGFDRTIYMFSVPSDRTKSSAYHQPLLILKDWLTDMTINPQRIETEKGIILEELRGYDVGDDFYGLKIGQGIFKDRMPLGNIEDIRNMTPETLKQYYRTWYVPELATLVIVGDIEPLDMELAIKKMFDTRKSRRHPDYRTYPLVYTPGIQISKVTDSLQLHDKVELIIPHPSITTRTLEDVCRQKTGAILLNALTQRFQNRKISCDVSNKWYLSDKDHLVFTVQENTGNDLPKSIASLSGELKNILENGFHPKEVEHATQSIIRRLGNTSDYRGRPSAAWCDELTDYVLSGDAQVSDSTQMEQIVKKLQTTDSRLLQNLLNNWLAYKDSTLLVAGRIHPSRAERLTENFIRETWAEGEKLPCVPYEYKETVQEEEKEVVTPACLETAHPFDPASIDSIRIYPELNIRDIQLTNGIRLILKPTREEGNILLTSVAPGGLASIPPKRFYQLEGIASYIDLGGIAKADYEQLEEYLYRNDMALTLTMESYWHGFMGFFREKDATAFFNLIYEKITDPELRYEDFEEVRKDLRRSAGKETLLDKMLSRTQDRLLAARLNTLMGNTLEHNEQTPDSTQIDALNLDSIALFYNRLYNEPDRTVYIVCGKFDPDTLMQRFTSVFSQMPRSEKPAEWPVPPVRLPEKTTVERFSNENETQTVFDQIYFGFYEPGLRNSLILKLMSNIIRNRLISDLRERESLVYSPYISLFYDGIPKSVYYFDINASVENRNMPRVQTLLRDILQNLRQKNVTEEELNKLKQSFLINKREALDDNNTANWRTTLTGLLKNGESLADFARYEECLNSITPTDILEAFRQYIDLDKYVLLYMSNQEIEKQ